MPISTNERVASEIRAEIARQQRRQSDLVDVLAVSQSGVSARLNGRIDLTLNEVVAIADWLGVDPATWFTRSLEVAS